MRSQTAILLRKVGGQAVALFSNRSYFGLGFSASPRTAGLLATVGAFAAILLVPIVILALMALALHGGSHGALLAFPYALGTVKELREKRANLHEQAQAILDRAKNEKRELNAEEQKQFDDIYADVDKMGKDVERMERHERVGEEITRSRGTRAGREDRSVDLGNEDDEPSEEEVRHQKAAIEKEARAYAQAFDTYVRFGKDELEPEQRRLLRRGFRKVDGAAVNMETRAQTVTTTGGGYLIPQGFQAELEANMKLYGGVEQACRVIETPTGNPLPWPTRDDTGNTGRLLAINTQATTTDLTYGVKTLNAYKFSSDVVLVPVELLQDSAINVDSEVGSALGERLGRVHNTYQTTGTGSSQPQGIVAGASSGVTAAGTSTVTFDEILELVHSVDPAYRNPIFGAGFMFNDTTLKKLRQIKDADGKPLWQPGIAGGAPSTIFDFPYTINQDVAAMTTGLKPILFGAMKKMIVRKVKGFTLLRLEERYADYHQVGFLAFTRMDSILLDSGTQDPVRYITMA